MLNWINSLNKNIISIIIPTYNRPQFLSKALNTLIKCERSDKFDVIIVEDGSTEFSSASNQKLISEVAGKFFNLQYIRLSENSGTVSIPRNIGISYAIGRTLAHVDDDCISKIKKYTMVDNLWAKESNLLVYGDREEYGLNGNTFEYLKTVNCSQFAIHKKAVGIDNGQFLYKADAYKYIQPSFAINACDWELYSSFADFGDFEYVEMPVCKYLWHSGNISKIPKPLRVKPLDVLANFMQYFNDGEFKDACKSVLNLKSN